MTSQILIASYTRDFPWLYPNLVSLRKHCTGFLPPTIVVNSSDEAGARELVSRTYPEAIVRVSDPKHPHQQNLRAQVAMMNGDIHCPEADVIFLVGSDCIMARPCDASEYFRDGRPILLFNTWAELGTELHWALGVDGALGFRPPKEYMRRLPLGYPRDVMSGTRAHIAKTHRKTFEDYVYDDAIQPFFSESNIMGAFADRFMHESFYWETAYGPTAGETMAKCPSGLIQFWSHGGLDHPLPGGTNHAYCGRTTVGRTPREVILETVGPEAFPL